MAKSRVAFSNEQKLALRAYRRDHPYLNGKQLIEWFQQTYGLKVCEAQISRWSSGTFSKLEEPLSRTASSRVRITKWPALEEALSQWHARMHKKKATITGDLIKEQARRFWHRLECYQGLEVPPFSNGWLDGFKQRHSLRKYARHGESGSVDLEQLEREMVDDC
jgi:hypothetical protein